MCMGNFATHLGIFATDGNFATPAFVDLGRFATLG